MTGAPSHTFLADLPVELFLDGVFSYLPVSDLLHLGSTNRFFNQLTNDEAYWHRRIQEDFNFSGSDTARKAGWKFLYKRLSNPLLYVWGEKSQGRLGLADEAPKTSVRDGVPYPVRLEMSGVRLVSLSAGGMSFHAIDSKGDIYVWGVLNGDTFALRNDGFAEPGQKADYPLRLNLPTKFRSISCGRLHATSLDAASEVWTFTSWGRPFRLISPLLDQSSPDTTPVQIESGWTFSSVLTQSGDVLVYWPFGGSIKREIDMMNAGLNDQESAIYDPIRSRLFHSYPGVIPCCWWDLCHANIVRLPAVPTHALPELRKTGLSSEQLHEETKLIKIAGLDNCIIGLTNKGHVLRYDQLSGEDSYRQGQWEYLPYFSDIERLRENAIYNTPEGGEAPQVNPPETMHITHISASFQTFFAYSTGTRSVVLKGNTTADPAETYMPTIIPELQNRAVISVVLGDYHYGALTATGELLTWGAFSKGALGLGDPAHIPVGQPGGYASEDEIRTSVHARWGVMRPPPDVRVPTPVRFDHDGGRGRNKYCFAAAALGWHTGALVIDLDPDGDDAADENLRIPGAFLSANTHSASPYRVNCLPANPYPANSYYTDPHPTDPHPTAPQPRSRAPFARLQDNGPYRVGHAGRGVHRGGSGRGEGGA